MAHTRPYLRDESKAHLRLWENSMKKRVSFHFIKRETISFSLEVENPLKISFQDIKTSWGHIWMYQIKVYFHTPFFFLENCVYNITFEHLWNILRHVLKFKTIIRCENIFIYGRYIVYICDDIIILWGKI